MAIKRVAQAIPGRTAAEVEQVLQQCAGYLTAPGATAAGLCKLLRADSAGAGTAAGTSMASRG